MTAPSALLSPLAWVLEEPRALWGLLLALPVVAVHLVRRRRQRLIVPALSLLREARGVSVGTSGWRRLAETGALLARLAALGVLVLALARPLAHAPAAPQPLVLVLDADVTTGVREADGRSRFRHLADVAAQHVRAHASGPLSVIVAQGAPHVVARDVEGQRARGDLAERIAALPQPGRGRGDLAAAARLARSLGGPSATVRVLSQRLEGGAAGGSEPEGSLPPGPLQIVRAGRTRRNQGVVDLSLAPPEEGPRWRARVTVANEEATPVERRFVAWEGDVQREVRTLALPGAGEVETTFELVAGPQGSVVRLALEGEDAFDPDDEVAFVLPAPVRPSVLVVHDGRGVRPYTAAALAALGERIDAQASGAVAAADLARAAPRDVTLVDGASLPGGALHAGAWLFLAPLSGALPFQVGEPLDRPLIWRARREHPLLLGLDLSAPMLRRAFPLEPGEGVVGLAFAGDERPVLAEGQRDGLRWIALGLDPEGGDLPLSAALPLLMRNALARLARAPAAALPPFVLSGGILRPLAPLPGGALVELTWEGGRDVAELTEAGPGWQVPTGLVGPLAVVGREPGSTYRGETRVLDFRRDRRVRPTGEPSPWPTAQGDPPSPGRAPLVLLLGLAALLLVVDLLLSRSAPRAGRAGARVMRGGSSPSPSRSSE